MNNPPKIHADRRIKTLATTEDRSIPTKEPKQKSKYPNFHAKPRLMMILIRLPSPIAFNPNS